MGRLVTFETRGVVSGCARDFPRIQHSRNTNPSFTKQGASPFPQRGCGRARRRVRTLPGLRRDGRPTPDGRKGAIAMVGPSPPASSIQVRRRRKSTGRHGSWQVCMSIRTGAGRSHPGAPRALQREVERPPWHTRLAWRRMILAWFSPFRPKRHVWETSSETWGVGKSRPRPQVWEDFVLAPGSTVLGEGDVP